MKVVVTSRSEEALEEYDYRDFMEISIDGDRAFRVSDGEPEDANLGRDFNACLSIPDLMRRAYEAGKAGEPFEVEHVEVGDE